MMLLILPIHSIRFFHQHRYGWSRHVIAPSSESLVSDQVQAWTFDEEIFELGRRGGEKPRVWNPGKMSETAIDPFDEVFSR
jgi:hypothetical protein